MDVMMGVTMIEKKRLSQILLNFFFAYCGVFRPVVGKAGLTL